MLWTLLTIVLAGPCASATTTVAMNQCLRFDSAAADWRRYRDTECRAAAGRYSGGTMAATVVQIYKSP
jgi:hypothetical protein